MEQCLLLSARRYDFNSKENGEHVEGVTLTYITETVETEGDTLGSQPMSVPAPMSIWSQLRQLPGIYDLDFKQRPGLKGKPTLQLVALKFVSPVELMNDVSKSSA